MMPALMLKAEKVRNGQLRMRCAYAEQAIIAFRLAHKILMRDK